MGFITGGSKSKQQSTSTNKSSNQAYGLMRDTYGDVAGNTGASTSAISALLGLGGDTAGQTAAFNNYKDSTGYDFTFNEGKRAIEGSLAARGLSNSGAALKALTSYGQNVGNQYFDNYLNRLFQNANQGFQAGQLISGAGNVSTGTSSSSGYSKQSNGFGSIIGGIGSMVAASDRRLKSDIVPIGTLANGLSVYSFTYTNTGERSMGVMSDEVREKFPEALGPQVNGYDTVRYSMLVRKAA